MSDVKVTVEDTIENVAIQVTEETQAVTVNVTAVAEDTVVTVQEAQGEKGDKGDPGDDYDPATDWFGLLRADVITEGISTTLPGEVLQYDYLGGVTYYRYIADDESIDAFYDSYTAPSTLGNLITRKRITITI